MKFDQLWLDDCKDSHVVEAFFAKISCEREEELKKTKRRILDNAKKELAYVLADKEKEWKINIQLGLTDENKESFHIHVHQNEVCLESSSVQGVLYASMHLSSLIRQKKNWKEVDIYDKPKIPLRMINHWDNLDGSIERGYSGKSFFFKEGKILNNERTVYYARLLASIGINAVCFNNVNVDDAASRLLSDEYYKDLDNLFAVFQSYGVSPYLSLNFASPISIGDMDSCDPCDEAVISWWEKKMDEVFVHLPNLGGFLVKADSEGRPGPFSYGRTQADGANMLASILQKHQAKLIWRAFVYNSQQDWRDYQTDRARAAYDYFSPLDGTFHENVYLQIKNGPMDFQVREPVSPLFPKMKKTNMVLEFQIAQEYTGQQIDLCYLAPMWREVLEFSWKEEQKNLTIAKKISRPNMGIAAVANTGDDFNWSGNFLASANLFAYGRLAWNPEAQSETILDEWILLSLGDLGEKKAVISKMMLDSREIYENYTAPLGIGWMVTPHYHYGPSVDGYEYDRWGTYHRADRDGIGVDRSSNGTDYANTYPKEWAESYNDPKLCPDELILFFHHLPYTFKLKSGNTIIQHIYNTHFDGYDAAKKMAEDWDEIEDLLRPEIFDNVKKRFVRQLENAREWRDQINTYFYRKSGISDEEGRKIY